MHGFSSLFFIQASELVGIVTHYATSMITRLLSEWHRNGAA